MKSKFTSVTLAAVWLALIFAATNSLWAATITVTNLADSGPGTLRQAIGNAASGDKIDFAVSGSIGPLNSDLVIGKALAISGPGQQQISVTPTYSGTLVTSDAVIAISGIKIAGADNTFPLALMNRNGGVVILSNCVVTHAGGVYGVIYNRSGCALTLINCDISGNRAEGIINDGSFSAWNSAISANQDAIIHLSSTNLTLVNCTLAQNRGLAAISINASSGLVSITNCTVTANSAPNGGAAGISSSGSSVIRIHNSIIAGNIASDGLNPDCRGVFDALDYNLIGNTNGCTITSLNAHNIFNTDPHLGPLGNYGGTTQTVPLLTGSPAIDTGDSTDAPITDQRGRARTYGVSSDIGAFESSPPYVIRGMVSGFTLHQEIKFEANLTNTVTTQSGYYSFENVSSDTYCVAPSNTNYLFVPTNRLMMLGPDQVGMDFKAYSWNALSIDGISNHSLQLAFPGTNGQNVQLLGSSNLVDWFAISTNTIPATNLLTFADSITNGLRFYRTASH